MSISITFICDECGKHIDRWGKLGAIGVINLYPTRWIKNSWRLLCGKCKKNAK